MPEPRSGTDPKLFRRFMDKVDASGDCWRWTAFCNWDGYGMFGIGRRAVSAHRVAYVIFCGDIPKGLSVLHRCDVPGCVRPSHLYVGTQAENVRDRVLRGRANPLRGENHGMAVLTPDDVRVIRAEISSGAVQRRLAERYGITPTTISSIGKRRLWKHLE